jgi:replicative DNA helicase
MPRVEDQYFLTCLLKGMMEDKNYALTVASTFEERYFDEAPMAEIFKTISDHVKETDSLPNRDLIINSIDKDLRDDVVVHFQEAESTDFDVAQNYEWLMENTNRYLKDRAIKRAIVDSVDLIDSNDDIQRIRNLIEAALCKDIRIDLGLQYFNTMAERLKRIFETSENRVRTYYPMLDELFNGGYPPYTLNMFIAKVHGHKSNIMTNMISRQVVNGVNVALASLEMSEDMFAQRFDANLTNLDINRLYINKRVRSQFLNDIKGIKANPDRGNLFIKEYPTGKASVSDFRLWLRELAMRDMLPDIFYCDYISLMKPEGKSKGDLYQDGKSISEELRALGFEFNIPVVTVAQINRAGTFMDFEQLDMNSIGESFGIPATADTMVVQGMDEDDMAYENELKYKVVKNRLGGRVGHIGKWYFDARSLRMYDETELEQWIADAEYSGDERLVYEGSE